MDPLAKALAGGKGKTEVEIEVEPADDMGDAVQECCDKMSGGGKVSPAQLRAAILQVMSEK